MATMKLEYDLFKSRAVSKLYILAVMLSSSKGIRKCMTDFLILKKLDEFHFLILLFLNIT